MTKPLRIALRRFKRTHPLLALLIAHATIGFGLAALFVTAIVAFDVGGVGRLLATDAAWPFAIVLWFFTGLTFASAMMGSAIMGLARHNGPGGRWVVVQEAAWLRPAPSTVRR
jgi:hypothetical protein